MKHSVTRYYSIISSLSFKNSCKAVIILVVGIIITIGIAYQTNVNDKKSINKDFEFICNDLIIKIDARLRAHAQIIRSGASFFAASDTVTRKEWQKYIMRSRINKNLPGIQGVGFAQVIPKNELNRHIVKIRQEGFPNYMVHPMGQREIYTSIIYLEPFSGRNMRAFGYDMFSEPIRRKAMELARDSDIAMLSGKVLLVQETNEDIQAGTLMYVPVYQYGMPTKTVTERRAAIKGWVYSPYRMNDLMQGMLGNWNLPGEERIHIKIYDNNVISASTLLYDSRHKEKPETLSPSNLFLKQPVEFNGKKWTVLFFKDSADLHKLNNKIIAILSSGFVISFLLFILLVALINSRQRERQILLLNNQLKKHNADKDRFISILAHDLKSPFNALLGFIDLLKCNVRSFDTDKIEAYVDIIQNSSLNVYNLLEDTLLWARTQSGKFPFKPVDINLLDLCSEVIESLKFNADNKNILVYCCASCNINVYADKNMLGTILRNLISNAIKFTNSGGKITIAAETAPQFITIILSDNGIGIKPDVLPQLFDFFHLYTTEGTNNEKGTGMGLLLCKEFVEKHSGKIWAESEVGVGSHFKFTIPRSERK